MSIGGQYEYWRHERQQWPGALDGLVASGVAALTAHVPWTVHMPAPDRQEWGATRPNADLAAFLRLCAERSLAVTLELGASAGATVPELTYPGYVLADASVQARDGSGGTVELNGLAVPSFAAKGFQQYLGAWFDAVVPRIAPFMGTRGGPVVTLAIGSDLALFARSAPFELDYHVDAVALYKRWTDDIYADPPRRWDRYNMPAILKWCRFREWLFTWGAERIAAMLRERGLGSMHMALNVPATTLQGSLLPGAGPADLTALEAVINTVGCDVAMGDADYLTVRKWARYVHAASRKPRLREPGRAQSGEGPTQEFYLRAALMHGAANVDSLSDGDLADGSLVALRGSRKRVDVLILGMREYGHLTAASVSAGHSTDDSGAANFGFSRPIAADYQAWYRAVEESLWTLGYTSDVGDDSLPLHVLARYRMVVAAAFDFMSRETQEKLIGYVRRGGHLVYGPMRPSFDAELRRFSLLGETLWPFVAEVDDWSFEPLLLDELEEVGLKPAARRDDPAIETVLHRLPDGREVLFVANPTAQERDVQIELAGRPLDNASPIAAANGEIRLPPYTIGVYEVTRIVGEKSVVERASGGIFV